MYEKNALPGRNFEGYRDPTAENALDRIRRMEDTKRHRAIIGTVLSMIRIAGFEPVYRIVLRDTKTGKIYE